MMDNLYKHPRRDLEVEQRFSTTELGFRHPFTGSYIRVGDDGSIQITVGDSGRTGITLDENGITIFGDKITILSGPNGFSWNGKDFNPCSDRVDEPTLISRSKSYRNPSRGFGEYK
jgi:hypothetical protein